MLLLIKYLSTEFLKLFKLLAFTTLCGNFFQIFVILKLKKFFLYLVLCYINDLLDGITSTIYMYADDTKLYREIKSPDDHQILQNDLSKLCTYMV